MDKGDIYKKEKEKLTEIFSNVDEDKRKLVEGLIEDASFLCAENHTLRQILKNTGMVKVHPTNPNIQKQTEVGKQYLKNINSYSVVIKTLNGILQKNALEEDDPFDKWLKEKMSKNE